MAGSRSNWESMQESLKSSISSFLGKSPQEKAEKASQNLGTGAASKAVDSIKSYKEKQRKAMEDAGI